MWSILRFKEDLVSGSPPKKFANNVWWPLHWFMKFSGYRKLRKNISGSKRFKIVAPYQRQNRAATPGWWQWTGTQTPSSGTPTSDPSGQTWKRCPIMFGSNKLSVEPTCSTAWLAMILERSFSGNCIIKERAVHIFHLHLSHIAPKSGSGRGQPSRTRWRHLSM